MPVVLSSWLSELVLVLAGGLVVLYLWFSRRYTYWTKRRIPQLEPSFPFGNARDIILGRRCIGEVFKDIYDKLKGHRFAGMYTLASPTLVVRDPDIIRNILVKDSNTFMDRGFHVNEEIPINRHLFALNGQKWRRLRIKLTPTFTSGKLKMMFPTIEACGRELAEVLEEKSRSGEVMEMREISARYTTDIIASVAFGIECHCQRNPDAEFRQWGRAIFQPSLVGGLAVLLNFFAPSLSKILKLEQNDKDVINFFSKMVRDTVNYREKNNVIRKDFMQLLIQLKNKGTVEDDTGSQGQPDDWKLSIDDVTAQAFVFFAAGFETSSTTMSFALFELSQHPDVQRKLQEDIDSVLEKHGGNMSYDAINEMSYLHKVVSETLRKYPPLPILNRKCNVEYKLPGSDAVLEKETSVVIPLLGLHMDPEHFPDPERFDPERFSEENKAARHPYVYMPFGEGPRICIGMRLGLLKTKVGLAHLLHKFSVSSTKANKSSVEFIPRSIILMSQNGIQLQLQKRK